MKKVILVFLTLVLFPAFSRAEELSLKNALDIAMEKSPAIVSARESVTAADGKLAQAFGSLLPNLSVSGQYGQSYTKPYLMAGLIEIGTEEASSVSGYTLTLSQPIYNAALFPGLQIAESGYTIAKESYKKAKYDLQYDVVSGYYGVLRANKMNELSQNTLDMYNSHLKQVRAMRDAGTATKADVLRVEVQVANNEVGLMRAGNALLLANDAFNNKLGRDIESSVSLSEREIVSETVTPEPKSLCLEMAFRNRPDWLIFQMNKQVNASSRDIAWGGYFPSVALVGTAANSKNEYRENDHLNTDINTNTIVASAQWDLFDGLAREGRIKESAANLAALEANEGSVRNGIVLEVKDACLALETSVKLIKSGKKAVDLARENYRISKERYKTGAGSNLEMIDAETAFTEAQTNLYQFQFDYQIAKARVNQATGTDIYPFGEKGGKQ